MRRGDSPQRVLTYCPVTGAVVATHAVMTAREFGRVHRELSFWCRACAQPHHRGPGRLWREGEQSPCEPCECGADLRRGAVEEPRRSAEGGVRGAPARATSQAPGE